MDALPLSRLRRLWASDRCALGVIVTIPSPAIVQILAAAELDFVLIDLEHAPIGLAEAHALIAATQGTRLVPLVRVAETTVTAAKAPLDLGALGVNFPFVSDGASARIAARAVRYPPRGDRSWGPFYAPLCHGMTPRAYQDAACEAVVSIATLEEARCLEHIDDILATPGLDCAVIGMGDIATGLGHKGRVDHPEVRAIAATLEARIAASPVVLGGPAFGPEDAKAKIARGYRLLAFGFDWSLLRSGLADAMAGVRA